MSDIQALILAAGRGSRMGGETEARPKCLIPLMGRPMLHWQLEALGKAGMDAITVARGYRAAMLTGDFRTVDNPRWSETNMVSTLLCALPVLESSPCVVSYSDIVYHPDHVRAIADAEADIAMLYDTDWRHLWETRFEDPLDDAETFREEGGLLREIGSRTNSYDDIQGQFMGLLRFTARGFATIRDFLDGLDRGEVDKLDMTALLKRLLDKNIPVAAIPVEGRWCEADSMDDVRKYEVQIKAHDDTNSRWSHDWR